MKALTALEISYLCRELGILVGAKIDRIYQEGRDLFLQFHVPNTGKRILKIMPSLLCFTDDKPSSCSGFCMVLRRYLANARLKEIKQVGFERILEFVFSAKKELFRLVIELFSKGNIILCKDGYEIIAPLETQHWKTRDLKRGSLYRFPPPRPDFFRLSEPETAELIGKSDRYSVVKAIAMDLGLGGVYAEEACILSSVNKEKKPSELSGSELKRLCNALSSFKNRKPEPALILDGENAIDAVPFELRFYDAKTTKKTASFSEALSVSPAAVENARISEMKRIIAEQESTITRLEEAVQQNTRKAELIYEHYALVKEILEELNKARKRLSWQEIKAKLKNHRYIKQINEKEGLVVVDI